MHCLSILDERFLARAPVAKALLINLQTKVLILGGMDLCAQVLLRISIVAPLILLAP